MSHIFLYGPSGSGKSTIGKMLAHDLKLPFVDSDQVIETNAGKPIPQIVEKQGIPKLRELEADVFDRLVGARYFAVFKNALPTIVRMDRCMALHLLISYSLSDPWV